MKNCDFIHFVAPTARFFPGFSAKSVRRKFSGSSLSFPDSVRKSGYTLREWGALFDVDNTLATALIDRLMHHGEALVIKGDSYRMKDKDNPSDPSA